MDNGQGTTGVRAGQVYLYERGETSEPIFLACFHFISVLCSLDLAHPIAAEESKKAGML